MDPVVDRTIPEKQSAKQHPDWATFAEFTSWCRAKLNEEAPLLDNPSLDDARKLGKTVAALLKDAEEGLAQLDHGPFDIRFEKYTDFPREDTPLVAYFVREMYDRAVQLEHMSPEERRKAGFEELTNLVVTVSIFNRVQSFFPDFVPPESTDAAIIKDTEYRLFEAARNAESSFFHAYVLHGIVILNSLGMQDEAVELTKMLSGTRTGTFCYGIGVEQPDGLDALEAPKTA